MDLVNPRKGPQVQSGSLIFLMLLILGLALAQDSVLLCPKKNLDVVIRTQSEMSMNGKLILSCKDCSQFAYSSFRYWLGNHSFIEHLPGKLQEDDTRRERQSGVTWLRDLVLEELSPMLQNTKFSCILVDPSQVTQHHVLLAQQRLIWKHPKLQYSATSQGVPALSHP